MYEDRMIRFIRENEIDTVLNWHFRHVDTSPGGRAAYAKRFPTYYKVSVSTIKGVTGFVLVAEDNGTIAGYVGVTFDDSGSQRDATLCGFYVVPERRRKGYGRALAEKAVATAREKGAVSMSVEAGNNKPWLLEFYSSVGFNSTSILMYQSLA